MTTTPLTDEGWYGKPEHTEDYPEDKMPYLQGEIIGGDAPIEPPRPRTEAQDILLAREQALPAEVRLREQEVRLDARKARRGERFRMTLENVETRSKFAVFVDDNEWLLFSLIPLGASMLLFASLLPLLGAILVLLAVYGDRRGAK